VNAGVSIIAATCVLEPESNLFIADPAALKVVGSDRNLYPKQTELVRLHPILPSWTSLTESWLDAAV
jgi:hypothetical protein